MRYCKREVIRMSYCVNCGVELHASCSICPLCHTEVHNPRQAVDLTSPTPYPSRRGNAAPAQKSDVMILISIVLAVTAGVCGLLNLLIFSGTYWSLYVIGGCVLLWIVCLPVFLPGIGPYVSILLDGAGIALYFGLIACLHPGRGWYPGLALPLTALAAGMLLLFAVCVRQIHASILSRAALVFGEIGVYTAVVELLIDRFRQVSPGLTWSAIVLTCCVIIDAALITIIRRSRLREEVRRRMHI